MVSPILSVNNLSVSFGSGVHQQLVLHQFALTLHAGQCIGLVGESGSGKTIAGLSILQLLPHGAYVHAEGQIIFSDKNLLMLSERKMRSIRGNRISMIFQDALSALNPVFTVGYQLLEVIRLHVHCSRKQRKLRVLELLASVGIHDPKHCYHLYPHQLSGGMRQRVMIAMAIAAEPDVIIADEPTTALDVTIQAQILSLLKKLKNEKNSAILFIGHDLSVVSQMADDVIVLEKGCTVEKASARAFFHSPQNEYSKKLLSAVLPIEARQLDKNQNESQPILTVEHLVVHFENRQGFLRRTQSVLKAVDDISFKMNVGETLAIVGESGSGKTTAAKSILYLISKTSGDIFFENNNLFKIKKRQLRKLRANMQIIFQDPFTSLNPRMFVADSLSEGLFVQQQVKNRKEALNQVDDLLEQVELTKDMKWRYPHEFSGGQRQRLCIARALSLSPKLLILDEPTSALDVSIQKQILALLEKLQKEKQLSYLLITHNLSVVAYLAHRMLVMRYGKIVEQGNTETVLTSPQHEYTRLLLKSVPVIN